MKQPIKVLSLGAGVQSSVMALMASKGLVDPMPDAAIFANTQAEPRAVYDWLDRLEPELAFPVYRVSKGDLRESATKVRITRDGERSYIETAIPVFTQNGLAKGKGQRHCTRDFKIMPIIRKVRELLSIPRVPADSGLLCEMWIGISTDESQRMKPSQYHWIEHRYPLIELRMSRDDCMAWAVEHGYPEPPRSACIWCPFRSDDSWRSLDPDEFDQACRMESELQDAYSEASEFDSVPYLHKSRVPLAQVRLADYDPQPSLFGNECEGMCGT